MAKQARYRTAPAPTKGMPPGIPYIVANEAAERYSYYGMRAILVIFMTKFLMNAQGELDVMTDEQAKTWFHGFVTAVYFFPILGGPRSRSRIDRCRLWRHQAVRLCPCGRPIRPNQ